MFLNNNMTELEISLSFTSVAFYTFYKVCGAKHAVLESALGDKGHKGQ